jgi:hypothetical protein
MEKGKDIQVVSNVFGKLYTGCIESAWKRIYRVYGKFLENIRSKFPHTK